MKIPFAGQSYQAASPVTSIERTVNFYPEVNNIDSHGQFSLIGTPGYKDFLDISSLLGGGYAIRGMHQFQGILLIIANNSLVAYNPSTKYLAVVGTLSSYSGRVIFRDNGAKVLGIGGNQVFISDSVGAYLWTYDGSTPQGVFSSLTGYTAKPYTPKAVSYTNRAAGMTGTNTIYIKDSQANLSYYQPGNVLKYMIWDEEGYEGHYSPSQASVSYNSTLGCIVLTGLTRYGNNYILSDLNTWSRMNLQTNVPQPPYYYPAGDPYYVYRWDCSDNIVVSGDVSTHFNAGDRIQLTDISGNVTYKGSASSVTYYSGISGTQIRLTGTLPRVKALASWGGLYFGDILINTNVTADYAVGNKVKVATATNPSLYEGAITFSSYRSAISATIMGTNNPYTVSNLANWKQISLSSSYLPATGVSNCEFIDGYFVATGTGSMKAFASNLYDGANWGALAFSPIQATSDPIQTVVALHEQLWHIKLLSTEIWYDAGTPTTTGYPFARIPGAVIDYGTEAPYTVAKCDNSIIFMANQRAGEDSEFAGILQFAGVTPKKISTPAIDYQISQMAVRNDAFAFSYKLNAAHTFYVITFPSGDRTFVYDAQCEMWHEWSSYRVPYEIGRHIANCYIQFNGMHLIGSNADSKIYQLSDTIYSDDDQPIIRERIVPIILDEDTLSDVFINKLVLEMETGVGNDQDPDPQVSLCWSDDQRNWSPQLVRSLGKIGEYGKIISWNRLGRTRKGRNFKLNTSSKCKVVVLNSYVQAGK